jgi:hypothetical protein
MRLTTDRRSGVTLAALAGVWLLALALFCVWAFAAPADCGPVGTDWYYECTTGDALDLTIQDEADTLISKERN